MPASNKLHKNRKSDPDDAVKLSKASKKPFKPAKKADRAGAAALQLDDDEPAFPRGGGSSLSRKERDEIRAEVDAEFVAEVERESKEKKKKWKGVKSKVPADEDDDLGSLFGGGISGKLPRLANKITMKNITPGMKLWGVVAEVDEKDLVVTLPGGLRGLVRASEALDSLSDGRKESVAENALSSVFQVGQLVACVVLHVDDDSKKDMKRKIWLSLRLSLLHKGFTLDSIQEGMVLTAYVKSVEDHGYILHFGLPSFTGFLAKNNHSESSDITLNTCRLLQGIVKNIDRTRKVVYLTSDPNTVSKHVTKDAKGISIDLLIPGMMINARVQASLENGVLLQFLTYFTGTVDIFHLENTFAGSKWQETYIKNKKVNARILFVDPSSRAIGLTLNPHLVQNTSPPCLVKIGNVYENSKVVRVDNMFGLLLEVPSIPVSTPAYVSISEVAQDGARNLQKKYREGSQICVRILGFRRLEGVATGTSKANAVEGSVFTHADVTPGMVMKAKITAVDPFGAIVQFPGGIKAMCPLPHMSELEISKPGKKFKVGAEMMFRVLGVKSKRITVTHKKTLVKSKLAILSSYTEATPGLIAHGWITKIEKHGCFVRFYNGVHGFAPRSELEIQAGVAPDSVYHVGQVVKCRIVSSKPASRRINLSFIINPTRIPDDDAIKVGSIVSGVVELLSPNAVVVYVNGKRHLKGTIFNEHLADHQGQATLMKSNIKPGYEFDQLLLLDTENNNMIFSAKYSLVKSALPSELSHVQPNSIVHGYITNVIETGCFVRFLGRLTGFSPRSKAVDDSKIVLSEAFYIGQSVRSNVLNVNKDTGRILLTLKQSSCASTDASFIQNYFAIEEEIAKLQTPDSDKSEMNWVDDIKVGGVVEGKIQEIKDSGVIVGFDKLNDVFGFVTRYQLAGNKAKKGSTVEVAVLDVSKTEHLVDLSLKTEIINKFKEESSVSKSHKKKRKKDSSKGLELHQTVNAVVEILKENYLVVSIPEHNYVVGYASRSDYNSHKLPQKQFVNGESVVATVVALPSPSTSGRLLLLLKSISDADNSKRAKKSSHDKVGSLVQAEVTEIRPLELRIKFGIGLNGRIHITEVYDDNVSENPFSNFKVGQNVSARIIGKSNHSDGNKKRFQYDLSVKPSVLSGSYETEDKPTIKELGFSIGQSVSGYVYKVDAEWVWLSVSLNVRAQLYILDSSCEPSELDEFQKQFHVGEVVLGHVLSVNKDKNLLRLVRDPVIVSDQASNGEESVSKMNVTAHLRKGCVLGGRVSKILPGIEGLNVQIGPYTYGRVHITELNDLWVPEPLAEYHEGQFVKCFVLEINKSANGVLHIDLSLRSSMIGGSKKTKENKRTVQKIEDLRPDMVVQGYVKHVTPRGCFIILSRNLDAMVLLSNLSDGFIKDPESEFPIGKLVTGRVLSVEPLSKRVGVTLRTPGSSKAKPEASNMSSLNVGDVITGTVKRVESFGLFISIDNTNMDGLCHKSELSDDRVDNIETRYRVGKRVRAKVVKVDVEKNRISLGMKESYGLDDENAQEIQDLEESDLESDSTEMPLFGQAESRAFVAPLEVELDDMDQEDKGDMVIQNQELTKETDSVDEKSTRQAIRKAKKEREREIKAAEERLLEKDKPRTSEEFEKLVRGSPNSSFIWIKYMDFVVSMAEVDKARSIAERALQTINIREENEKLNIWKAYFNLENKYGSPPEEAVQKLFQRALQYNDPKRVYLALLDLYERTEKNNLANELVEKMTKKFKQSCKVWLRRVQRLLSEKQDDIQSVINRALLSLPRHKHIKFISHTAILEFRCGVPHRGRSMFEGILKEYSKRTDLWSVYLDQEIRFGDTEVIRALFERATSMTCLPAKKMKFLFKKFLDYEKVQGNEERIEYVKKKAMDFVQSKLH